MLNKGRSQRANKSATFERALLFGAVSFALLALTGGCYLARRSGDAHWVNRAGAAIVAAEGAIVIVEFVRRARLQKILNKTLMGIPRDQSNESTISMQRRIRSFDTLEGEIERAELQVLVIAVLLAMTGELLHGFGDLLFKSFLLG